MTDNSDSKKNPRAIPTAQAELLRSLLPLVVSFSPEGVPLDQAGLPHDRADLRELHKRIGEYLERTTQGEHERLYEQRLKALYPEMYEQIKGDDDAG